MERALRELCTTLRELRRADAEIRRLREECAALRGERDRARRAETELREQLVDLQKLEAVGRLARGIGHDFNNLLLIVMGRAELLLQRLGESDRGRKQAFEIRRAGRRAMALARQLLVLSRPKEARRSIVDCHKTIAGMREMLELVAGETISLELRLEPGAGSVALESGQIEQIVLNLAMNARDAMPKGGRLTVSSRRESIPRRAAAAGEEGEGTPYVVIAVSDTGFGMDEATRARIFEPYFTTKSALQGSGLGLASVRSIVSQAEGFLRVDSAPGAGSVFEVYLPAVSGDEGEREGSPELVGAGESEPALP